MNHIQPPPLVTVLMSCYNSERWLGEAISSVLEQTFTNFEFLIIDDGSTDSSLSILEFFSFKDSRIKLIKKSNTGLADSLNIGLNCARGKWIARMDADDRSEPRRLEKQVNFVSCNADLVFLGSGLTIIDESGRPISECIYPRDHKSLLDHLLTARRFPPHSSAFYLSTMAREIGGYRKRIRRAEDCDLWLRLSCRGNLACIEEPLVQIRKHSQQITLSGGGCDALIDNRLSIISYLAVKENLIDPIELSDNEFESFVSWIKAHLHAEKYFEYWDWKIKLKKRNEKARYISFLCKAIINPIFSFRLIQERLKGDRFGYETLSVLLKKKQYDSFGLK